VSQAGMGNSGVALFDPYKLNTLNPAVVAYHLDPILNIAGRVDLSRYSTENESFENEIFGLENISLSIPIQRGTWGATFGLQPYTSIGYDVTTSSFNPDINAQTLSNYSGDGGISQAYLGTAYKVFNEVDTAGNVQALSIGANTYFNFGNIDNNRALVFPDDPAAAGLITEESIVLKGFTFEVGAHYQYNIVKRSIDNGRYLKLLLGATYSMGKDVRSEKNAIAYSFIGNQLSIRDTVSFSEDNIGYVHIPQELTVGAGLDYVSTQKSRLRFSLDYSTQKWSEYEEGFGVDDNRTNLEDSYRIGTGLEYTPTLGSTKYLRTVQYRLGFKYEKTNLMLQGEQIEDIGMSFGLSLPIHHRRNLSQSAFHISGQYGTFGTTDSGLIQEEYLRVYVGFTFTPHFRNRWFVQPKYD
jgi:hypothetical protein